MSLTNLQEIERAINALPAQKLVALYAWLDRHRPQNSAQSDATVELAHCLICRCRPVGSRLSDRNSEDFQAIQRTGVGLRVENLRAA